MFKNFAFLILFLAGCFVEFPPDSRQEGHFGFVRTDLVNETSTSFPFSPEQMACLTYSAFSSFADVNQAHVRLQVMRDSFAHSVVMIVSSDRFEELCLVPTSQAAACLRTFTSDRAHWVAVIPESLISPYRETPGEPIIHEWMHALLRMSSGEFDYRHENVAFWASHGDVGNLQGVTQRKFSENCLFLLRDN